MTKYQNYVKIVAWSHLYNKEGVLIMNKVLTIKRFVDESGDVEVIKQKVFDYIDDRGLNFTHAEVEQNGLNGPRDDPERREFYPLRIFASDGTVLMISEVRTGYQGASSRALIEILRYAGFSLEREFVDSVFNERKIRRIINF